MPLAPTKKVKVSTKAPKSKRGGKREGAGRHPTGKLTRPVPVELHKDVIAQLEAIATSQSVSIAAVIRTAISEFLARRV